MLSPHGGVDPVTFKPRHYRRRRRRAAAGAAGWIAVERERGISVSSAVMRFEHEGLAFILLDTPGHQDFNGISGQTPMRLATVDKRAGGSSIRLQERSRACPEGLHASRHEGAVVFVLSGVRGQL